MDWQPLESTAPRSDAARAGRLPLGRRIELPRRGTTFVREVAGPARRADPAPAARLGRQRRPQLVPGVRAARRSTSTSSPPTCAATPAACAPAASSGSPTAPTTARRRSSSSTPARSSWSATRWAARSRSCCGAATATSSTVSCCARRTAGFIPEPPRAARVPVGDARARSRAARAAALAARAPVRCPLVPAPSQRLPAWAAAEMRRHDWRMIVEAGHSISTYNAGRWIGEVDVPTAVVCTTEDRGVAPDATARDRRRDPRRDRPPDRRRASRLRRTRASPSPLVAPASTSPPAPLTRPPSADAATTSAHQRGRSRRAHARGTQPRTMPSQRVGVAEREHDVPDDHDEQHRARTSRARTSRRCASCRGTARTSA